MPFCVGSIDNGGPNRQNKTRVAAGTPSEPVRAVAPPKKRDRAKLAAQILGRLAVGATLFGVGVFGEGSAMVGDWGNAHCRVRNPGLGPRAVGATRDG